MFLDKIFLKKTSASICIEMFFWADGPMFLLTIRYIGGQWEKFDNRH